MHNPLALFFWYRWLSPNRGSSPPGWASFGRREGVIGRAGRPQRESGERAPAAPAAADGGRRRRRRWRRWSRRAQRAQRAAPHRWRRPRPRPCARAGPRGSWVGERGDRRENCSRTRISMPVLRQTVRHELESQNAFKGPYGRKTFCLQVS